MSEVPSLTQTREVSNRSKTVEEDLGPPSSLEPDLEYFLGGCMPQERAEGRRDSPQDLGPKPLLEDHCKWIEWWGQCINMPAWWQGLEVIPDVEDHQELTQKVRSSFEVLMARS